ncbi:MAG: GNAT family N-acetyltransferase [Clostridiales Family XIII bacterium]|jgi:ribosomal protein S18 acetylase RimI-like enzyme|nr:GNAT family N-acetyltransferase [Clostridiales Family XIII bacterium]
MTDKDARIVFIRERNLRYFEPFLRPEDGGTQTRRAGGGVLRLGCAVGEIAVGAAEAELRGHGACIVSIAVAPSFRRRGLAFFLTDALIKLLRDTGSLRVCASLPGWADNAEILRRLLRKVGFERESADNVYIYSLAEIAKRPLISEMAERAEDPHVRPLSEASDYRLRLLNLRIAEHGGADGLAGGSDLDREACVFYRDADDLRACILFARGEEGLEVRWLHGDPPSALYAVVASGVKRVLARRDGDLPVRLAAVHPSVDGIALKLLGEPKETTVIDTYRIDL